MTSEEGLWTFAIRCPPSAPTRTQVLLFGRGEGGLFSLIQPMRMQDGALEPALNVLTANVFDCGPFQAGLKVYGSLFLAIIVINTALYGWRLAALRPLLIFIICLDGTSNKAMYLPLRGRLSHFFADRLANRSFLQPKAALACPRARSVSDISWTPRRPCSQYLYW
jgi:hypothetical protein